MHGDPLKVKPNSFLDVCFFGYAPNMSVLNLVHAIHCLAINIRISMIYRWQDKIDILYDKVIEVYVGEARHKSSTTLGDFECIKHMDICCG